MRSRQIILSIMAVAIGLAIVGLVAALSLLGGTPTYNDKVTVKRDGNVACYTLHDWRGRPVSISCIREGNNG